MTARKHTTDTRQLKMNNENKMSIEYRQNELAKRIIMNRRAPKGK